MTACKVQPFASWQSPIKAEMLAGQTVKLGQTYIDENGVYWTESRPWEKGRSLIVASDFNGKIRDLTPPEFNVRNSVHEYGGGAAIIADNSLFFSSFSDHRIYKQDLFGKNLQVLSEPGPFRYADFCFDKIRNRLIVVKEDHGEEGAEPLNFLETLNLENPPQCSEILLAGSDFFSSPRISPDGKLLAWITWNHPFMPWDESKLWTGNLGKDGSLSNIQQVAGGKGESISQPEWGPDGALYFVSDKNGYWNLYASYSGLVEPLLEMEAEFCSPQWVFGLSNYALTCADRLICSYNQRGFWQLAEFDLDKRVLKDIESPYKDISYLRASSEQVVFRGGAPDRFAEIVSLDLAEKKFTVLKKSNELEIDSAYFSQAEPIEFNSRSGKAYAFFYPAKNPEFEAPPDSKPPLIVKSHGGPTSACSSTLDLSIQYWTSRGFSVVDVNYGGSTGYGRAYRERLNGNWGIVDIDDCVSAVKYLSENGKIDPKRVAISGGSAGGFTTLACLAFRSEFFSCGASYYGVSELAALASDTHKFESRYLDGLVGPYPSCKDIYDARSPLKHAGKIKCPLIFFQGLEDKVVPPSQSESMVKALKQNGRPVSYLTFEGEQHGFRKAETIKTCLQAELSFYCLVFGVERADRIALDIANGDSLKSATMTA